MKRIASLMTLMQLQKTQEHCSTCFKIKTGVITDLILIANNNLFVQTHSFETGTSNPPHLIHTIFKTT